MSDGRSAAQREDRDVVQADTVGISRAWVIEKLQENALKALSQKHGSSVANRALELIGKQLVSI